MVYSLLFLSVSNFHCHSIDLAGAAGSYYLPTMQQQQHRGYYSQMTQVRPRWNTPVQPRFSAVTQTNQQVRPQVSSRPITGQAAQNGPRMANSTPQGRPPMPQNGQNAPRPSYKYVATASRNNQPPAQPAQQVNTITSLMSLLPIYCTVWDV